MATFRMLKCLQRSFSKVACNPIRICVVGSGPAGFYTAEKVSLRFLLRISTIWSSLFHRPSFAFTATFYRFRRTSVLSFGPKGIMIEVVDVIMLVDVLLSQLIWWLVGVLLSRVIALGFLSSSPGLETPTPDSSCQSEAGKLGVILVFLFGCVFPTLWRENFIFFNHVILEPYLMLKCLQRSFSKVACNPIRICVVGRGPAGFYTAEKPPWEVGVSRPGEEDKKPSANHSAVHINIQVKGQNRNNSSSPTRQRPTLVHHTNRLNKTPTNYHINRLNKISTNIITSTTSTTIPLGPSERTEVWQNR
ncbi:hypothetical protein LIER_17853 [Lithospermum erythrorhizon]|uniref:Uncharacterized protein n=1 Tax=Lithospermum erythrorhizon TaxID=34254 RepID=A0AAV3QG10_LITER